MNNNKMEITRDFFYRRKVIINQHKKGYRFAVDAPLLADFLPELPGKEALEIGTGSGIISMLALYKKKFSKITALELQEPLCRLAKQNAKENGFDKQFKVVHCDFNEKYKEFKGISIVFSNPPYFPLDCGRLSPNPEIRDAKSETRLTLEQLISGCRSMLGEKGSLYLVLPYNRAAELFRLAPKYHLSVARSREVFSFKDGKPERFLVQLNNYDVSPEIMKPLIIFKNKGIYTEEMDIILTG